MIDTHPQIVDLSRCPWLLADLHLCQHTKYDEGIDWSNGQTHSKKSIEEVFVKIG